MTKQVITVGGMSCEHCVKAVTEAVKALPGVGGVKVNLKKGVAEVKFDGGKIVFESIKEAIREAGFEA